MKYNEWWRTKGRDMLGDNPPPALVDLSYRLSLTRLLIGCSRL